MNPPNNKPGRERSKIAREITKYLLDRSFGWFEDTDTQTATILAIARELAPFFTSKLHQATEEAQIDALTRVDGHNRWYPEGREPITVYDRIDELKAQLTAHQNNKEAEDE